MGSEILSIKASVVTPFGLQVQKNTPWYPQELCNEWPNLAIALTLGESKVVKYGQNYPVRTGLDPPQDSDFTETIQHLPILNGLRGELEELFVSKGVCLLSVGPLGGQSKLKALYRPQTSYGTGIGIRSAIKAYFNKDSDSSTKEAYICLAEKGGITLYSEDSSENHVAYMPDFQIKEIIPCCFGMIVIPIRSKLKIDGKHYTKGIYVLTNPVKQISRIWLKSFPDYREYESEGETLLWCESDLCVFWNFVDNKIILRKLVKLAKKDITDSTTLNASLYSNQELLNADTSNMFLPFNRYSAQKSAMKVNKEGNQTYYWPTFDFSDSVNPGLAHGFYPPHVCVYDDVELALNTILIVNLAKGYWEPPRKFILSMYEVKFEGVKRNKIGLWSLIKNNLYLHGVDLGSGTILNHYAIKNVEDFCCPTGPDSEKYPFVVILETTGQLKIAWLDDNFNILSAQFVSYDLGTNKVVSVSNILYGDTIICEMKDNSKKLVKLELRNYRENNLVATCIDSLKGNVTSKQLTSIIINYTKAGTPDSTTEWEDFVQSLKTVLMIEPFDSIQSLGTKIIKEIDILREANKIYYSKVFDIERLEILQNELKNCISDKLIYEKAPSIFSRFKNMILCENATELMEFQTLPEVMQILLNDPDNIKSLEKLARMNEKEEKFIPMLEILITDVFHRNRSNVRFDWPECVISAVGRTDYLSGENAANSIMKDKIFEVFSPYKKNDLYSEEASWVNPVLNMQVFSEDRRLEEVCRVLDSSSPINVDVEQRSEMSDHEYVEEQEKHLLQLIQISFAASVGRAAFTLRTEEKNYANLTSIITIPRLCLSGKCVIKGTSVELNDSELPVSFTSWPNFHNAVASALSVHFTDAPADAWFAYNKSKTTDGPEQAGMVLGFGLNGILSSMPPTLRHDHLSKENSFTTMAMLLGLSANLAGTGDISTWKLLSLHIGAMLPTCTTELEIPRLATLVAPCALGLLFMGTHNSHIGKILIGEISKKYSPLSVFGGGTANNSTSNINVIEASGMAADREAHSLCAGFGLGFVNLGKGRLSIGLEDEGFDGILRRFVVGGPKPTYYNNGEEEDPFNQFGQTLPSLWEEYRCCHIEEGDNVNVDVTTPSAIIAVALIYLRSGNEAVLKWLSPPSTLHLLDGVRPDLLMLRALASILVMEEVSEPNYVWLEENLMPTSLLEKALRKPDPNLRIDHESINQAWASIVCGYCLGLGIRFAGTSDSQVEKTLWHYINAMLHLFTSETTVAEYFPKNFLDSSVCNLLLSLCLVMAGTGNIPALRLCRYLQSKISTTQITSSSNTYGFEMCVSMATGILFLGGGRYSLSNDDKSIAVLLASVFPKWPINSNDNRYHLQALRHLYVLATQPRLILPKPMPHNAKLYFNIEFNDGKNWKTPAPVLLPPFYLIKRIWMDESEFNPVEFNLPEDLGHLKKIVEGGGILNLVLKPIGAFDHGFMKNMAWREEHSYHPTFSEKDACDEELFEVKTINFISRLAEWKGLKQIIPALLALRSKEPKDEDWILQMSILYLWIFRSEKGPSRSSIETDLLAIVANNSHFDLKGIFEGRG